LGDKGTTESNLAPAIKILHLITSLEVGGEQHVMLTSIRGLSKRNFRILVCSVMDKIPMSGQFEQIGAPVHSLGLRGKYDPRVYWRLWRLLRRERPDILHTHLIHANLLGRIIGRLAGVPAIVASEVTVGRPRRLGTIANRLTNRLVDRIETNALAVQRWLHETYRTPLDKILVIPSGVETGTVATVTEAAELKKSLGISRDDRVVVYVGRLEKEKGVEFGVRAFVEIADEFPEVRLVVAGEGRERESLDNIAYSSGYTDRIDLIGHTDEIPALMAIADVVLLPSLTEGLSQVILEAMVASRAVVATRVGGSAEVVEDGKTGFIVPARNASDLADALRRILGNVSLSQRMGQAGRRRVETEYSQEKYLDRLSAMYAELICRTSRKN
jgi:glycosyltransferase involved in cell wall biosynthesis